MRTLFVSALIVIGFVSIATTSASAGGGHRGGGHVRWGHFGGGHFGGGYGGYYRGGYYGGGYYGGGHRWRYRRRYRRPYRLPRRVRRIRPHRTAKPKRRILKAKRRPIRAIAPKRRLVKAAPARVVKRKFKRVVRPFPPAPTAWSALSARPDPGYLELGERIEVPAKAPVVRVGGCGDECPLSEGGKLAGAPGDAGRSRPDESAVAKVNPPKRLGSSPEPQ